MRYKYSALIWKPTSTDMMENALRDHNLIKPIIMAKFIIIYEFYYNSGFPLLVSEITFSCN